MVGAPALPTMIYAGFPPELNTFRLQAGAGPGPMMEAAAAWEALALSLETQADELAASLAALSGAWTGTANEGAVTATMPMVLWLRMLSLQAAKRGMQAAAQATAHTTAFTATPQLPELAENHITNATLNATNFLGVNTPAIGLNEADYMRMWDQAAAVMDGYAAETSLNTVFEPITPSQPIVIPGVGEAAASSAVGQLAALMPLTAARDLAITHVSLQSTAESVGLNAGRGVAMGNMGSTTAEGQASKARNTDTGTQAPQQMMQVVSQIGSQVGQIPQQIGQMVQGPMQQLTQPMQQAMSMFSQMGGGQNGTQVGLMGAHPLSDHPLAGGSGMSAGAGLVRAASLPGAGRSAPRTQLLAKLVDKVDHTMVPAAVAPGAAAGATVAGGSAPVGGGGGAGSGAPVNTAGRDKQSSGKDSKAGLKAPAPLVQDLRDDDGDDW